MMWKELFSILFIFISTPGVLIFQAKSELQVVSLDICRDKVQEEPEEVVLLCICRFTEKPQTVIPVTWSRNGEELKADAAPSFAHHIEHYTEYKHPVGEDGIYKCQVKDHHATAVVVQKTVMPIKAITVPLVVEAAGDITELRCPAGLDGTRVYIKVNGHHVPEMNNSRWQETASGSVNISNADLNDLPKTLTCTYLLEKDIAYYGSGLVPEENTATTNLPVIYYSAVKSSLPDELRQYNVTTTSEMQNISVVILGKVSGSSREKVSSGRSLVSVSVAFNNSISHVTFIIFHGDVQLFNGSFTEGQDTLPQPPDNSATVYVIVGIVGSIALILCLAIIWYICKRRRNTEGREEITYTRAPVNLSEPQALENSSV